MKLRVIAGALLLSLAGSPAAQQGSPEQEAKREQDALKRAKVHRIVGIPGVTASLAGTLKDLGAKTTGKEAKIDLAADALFEPDKADLKPEGAARLQKVALVLREFPAAPVVKPYPPLPVLIECYHNGTDTDEALATKRLYVIKDWLLENAGIDPVRLTTRVPSDGAGGRVGITVRKD
jgi:outer membrane protein OmpA-like peptidoglycan-associated protein